MVEAGGRPWPDFRPLSRPPLPEPLLEPGDALGTDEECVCELEGSTTGTGFWGLWLGLWLLEVDVDEDVAGSGEGFPPTFPGGVGFAARGVDVVVGLETTGTGDDDEENDAELEGTLQRLAARLASCAVRF